MKNRIITVIIPTLNEVECIETMLEELCQFNIDEVLVVDGHSTDGTPELVKKLGFKVVMQEGRGYGNAVNTGLKHARGDIIIPMDADLSYNPSDIPRLIEVIEAGYDVVFGSRYLPESGSDDDTWIRYMGNSFFTLLLKKIHGVNLSDSLFLYAASKKEVYDLLSLKSSGFEYCIEFPIKVHKNDLKYTEIASAERKRFAGQSKVNAFFDGLRILWYLLKWRFID